MKLFHPKIVLAAIDVDESSVSVLQGARDLADAAGATLHVVNVAPSKAGREAPTQPDDTERKRAIRPLLDRAHLTAANVPVHLLAGEPAHAIRSLADGVHADVIVLGRHRDRRPPSSGQRLGSTALGVVTNSWAPCLVLSKSMRLPIERVLVPVDLSETSRGALVVGLSWASALRGARKGVGSATDETVSLTALFVDKSAASADRSSSQPRALEDELSRLRADAGQWAGVTVSGATRSGNDVGAAIADVAHENGCDLLVLGTRGLGLDDVGRLGSVSLAVARRVEAPILLVPPAVWRTYAGSSHPA